MMAILTIDEVDVQGDSAMVRKRLEKFPKQGGIEIADPQWPEIDMIDQIRPSRQVHDDTAQTLIHRNRFGAIALDAFLGAQGIFDGLAQTDPQILDKMMVVDVRIASSFDDKIEQTMTGKKVQHVIQERNRRIRLRLSRPIQVYFNGNIRLIRFTADLSGSHHASLYQVAEKLDFVQAVQKLVPYLIRDVQMQGAQKLRNETYTEVRRLTKLAAQRSRRRPRESVGWTFFNSLRYMTLFKAYSIKPSAPASRSRGIKSRTTLLSTTVSTANHSC